jgi:CAAX prenyl protease-like protein
MFRLEELKSLTWLPYVMPMMLYLALLGVESSLPYTVFFGYPVRIILVATTLWLFRKRYQELVSWRSLSVSTWLLAIAVGLVAIGIWIALDPYYPKFSGGQSIDPRGHELFIMFRVIGAVLVVPVMEELFWRAFLIRWLVDPDFQRVPVGAFTVSSFAMTVLLFGFEHHQWLAGLICGALYNWLYYRRRNIIACIVAHAVSNGVLAAWVLTRHDWKFW